MADQTAKIDNNRERTLLGVTDDANAEIKRLLVDANGRLLVSAVIAGVGVGSEDSVQTTDATETEIIEMDAAEDAAYHVEAIVVAKKSDGTQRAVFKISGLFYRATGGNVTQQGNTQALSIIRSDSDWLADFNANTSAQTIEVKVTGKAATTIDWQVYLNYYEVT